MKTLYKILFILLLLTQSLTAGSGSWVVGTRGAYTQPAGGLSNWFQAAPQFSLVTGTLHPQGWSVLGTLERVRYDRENLSGYAADHVELWLEHVGVLLQGRYALGRLSGLHPYLDLTGGIYRWSSSRGTIAADPEQGLPAIPEKRLEAWNWGARLGLGVRLDLGRVSVDLAGGYRFVVGDLWPTMQPPIELDGVSGFQTWIGSVGILYRLSD